MSLLTFLRECGKQQPPHAFGAVAHRGKRGGAAQQITAQCVPFAAALLRTDSFPPHLLKNAKLRQMAAKYNEKNS